MKSGAVDYFHGRIEMKLDMRLDREDERSCVDGGCRILIIIDRFWCRVHCPIVENQQSAGDYPLRMPGLVPVWRMPPGIEVPGSAIFQLSCI